MIYIAFFRGINVGRNRIKMDNLRSMFEAMGFTTVKTHIQSGNVLFKSILSTSEIVTILEKKFVDTFGFSSAVVLRTKDQHENIIKNLPFTEEEIDRAALTCIGECLYVTMLKEIPTIEGLDYWKKYKTEIDEFKLNGRDLYLLVQTTIRDSKLSNNIQKLEKSATLRNWNTIRKMFELAKEIDEVE